MKRLLSTILCLGLLFSALPAAFAQADASPERWEI
jgi:hypothetical protein